VAVVAALVPGEALVWGQAGRLFEGLPAEEFRLLSLYVQNPQHMVPELWRRAQWLAWFGFPILASLEVLRPGGGWPGARQRWAVLLTLTLLGLGLAWVAVGPLESLRAAVFQPFRMATVVRGLCLVAIGARAVRLWQRGRGLDQMRAGLLVGGLAGDEAFVVVVLLELGASAAARLSLRASTGTAVVALAGGLLYLARHDPHSGHLPLLAAGVIAACGSWASRRRRVRWTTGRLVRLNLLAWTVPALALILPLVPTARSSRLTEFLIARCRFGETPIDAVERLGLWCRAHTPPDARFIGPPGPKTFRLWSRRELAFNRAASPYHAAGLADWARRFQDHVGFRGGTAAFARSYLADRQALEARYEDLSDAELVHLARRQGATHILASARRSDSPLLERLRVDGEYAIYRIRELPHVAHQDQGENQEQRRK
jgi:hypothetical protein